MKPYERHPPPIDYEVKELHLPDPSRKGGQIVYTIRNDGYITDVVRLKPRPENPPRRARVKAARRSWTSTSKLVPTRRYPVATQRQLATQDGKPYGREFIKHSDHPRRYIDELMCLAYHGDIRRPEQTEVVHKNGILDDNNRDNLVWMTPRDAERHRAKIRLARALELDDLNFPRFWVVDRLSRMGQRRILGGLPTRQAVQLIRQAREAGLGAATIELALTGNRGDLRSIKKYLDDPDLFARTTREELLAPERFASWIYGKYERAIAVLAAAPDPLSLAREVAEDATYKGLARPWGLDARRMKRLLAYFEEETLRTWRHGHEKAVRFYHSPQTDFMDYEAYTPYFNFGTDPYFPGDGMGWLTGEAPVPVNTVLGKTITIRQTNTIPWDQAHPLMQRADPAWAAQWAAHQELAADVVERIASGEVAFPWMYFVTFGRPYRSAEILVRQGPYEGQPAVKVAQTLLKRGFLTPSGVANPIDQYAPPVPGIPRPSVRATEIRHPGDEPVDEPAPTGPPDRKTVQAPWR